MNKKVTMLNYKKKMLEQVIRELKEIDVNLCTFLKRLKVKIGKQNG